MHGTCLLEHVNLIMIIYLMCKVWAAQEYIYQSETYLKTKAIFLTCYTVPSSAIPILWVLWNCLFYSQHSSPITLLKSTPRTLPQSVKSHLTIFYLWSVPAFPLGQSFVGFHLLVKFYSHPLSESPQRQWVKRSACSCLRTEKNTSWSQPKRMVSCLVATLDSSSSTSDSQQGWFQRACESNHM